MTLKLYGQDPVVNIIVDQNAIIKTQTIPVTGSIKMLILNNSKDIPLDKMSITLGNERRTSTIVNTSIPNGLYFKPKLGTIQIEHSIGSVKNLFLDKNGTALVQESNSQRTAMFDFYIKPDEVSSVMKPGIYTYIYDIKIDCPGLQVYNPSKTITFIINVQPYVIVDPVFTKPVQMTIDNFSFFRDGYKGSIAQAVRQTYKLRNNVPYNIAVATTKDQFDFTKGSDRNSNTGVKGVSAIVTVAKLPPAKRALAKNPILVNVANVQDGGYTDMAVDFEILPEQLLAGFLPSGNYQTETNVIFTTTAGITLATMNLKPFEVVVNPLSDLRVNRNAIDLTLQSSNDYQKGVSVTVADNLTFSSTSKYNITVKASSDKFIGVSDLRATMSCGILYIGSVNQAGELINEVQLSPNPQNIFTGDTAFETNLGIRYAVKPSPEVIRANTGAYTIEVIYGITAQ